MNALLKEPAGNYTYSNDVPPRSSLIRHTKLDSNATASAYKEILNQIGATIQESLANLRLPARILFRAAAVGMPRNRARAPSVQSSLKARGVYAPGVRW